MMASPLFSLRSLALWGSVVTYKDIQAAQCRDARGEPMKDGLDGWVNK